MSRAEIHFRAKLRKLAKLLRKRSKILGKLAEVDLDEFDLDGETALEIEQFLAQKKKR